MSSRKPQLAVVEGPNCVDIVAQSETTAAGGGAAADGQQQEQQGETVARIFLPKACIDSETLKQVMKMSSHPSCAHVRCMPDCGAGNGCVVGLTARMQRLCVSPQCIGGDISCGITSHPLPADSIERRPGLERLRAIIDEVVPVGSAQHAVPVVQEEQLEPWLDEATALWANFCASYWDKFGVDLDEAAMRRYGRGDSDTCAAAADQQQPAEAEQRQQQQQAGADEGGDGTRRPAARFAFSMSWLRQRCVEWDTTMLSLMRQLATVGGGNHFVEVAEKTDVIEPPVPGASGKRRGGGGGAAGGGAAGGGGGGAASRAAEGEPEEVSAAIALAHEQRAAEGDETEEEAAATQQAFDALPQYLLTTHCGSRAAGQAVYRYWVKKALANRAAAAQQQQQQQSNNNNDDDEAHQATLAALDAPRNDDTEPIVFNDALALTDAEDVACYFLDAIFCDTYARVNRRAILSLVIANCRGAEFDGSQILESVHNYIDFNDCVMRKGAIRAAGNGDRVLIALSMRDGMLVGTGKNNPDWNGSAPHGCGRVISRKAAAAPAIKGRGKQQRGENPKVAEFRREMEASGVLCRATAGTYPERPAAYRNSRLVINLLRPAVKIFARYQPLINCKGDD